ncbi:MAG: hypothetical protein ACRCY9_22380 [Phycicoccus sp.]
MIDTRDHDSLAAAVDLILDMLASAERQRSFPEDGVGDENERAKRDLIKLERRRYKELRARLRPEEQHGVPGAREFLDAALGLYPSVEDDAEDDALYERWRLEQAWRRPE